MHTVQLSDRDVKNLEAIFDVAVSAKGMKEGIALVCIELSSKLNEAVMNTQREEFKKAQEKQKAIEAEKVVDPIPVEKKKEIDEAKEAYSPKPGIAKPKKKK